MVNETTIYDRLKQEAQPYGGILNYAQFTRVALYDPQCGYYNRQHQRVGRQPEADFYTAESLGPVFSRLLAAAAVQLLEGQPPGDFELVEFGAEPGSPALADIELPFRAARCIPLGSPFTLKGKCVVFANELLDAQPFHRLVFSEGRWQECGVAVAEDGTLRECRLPEWSPPVSAARLELPAKPSEGYCLDLSLQAEVLLQALCEGDWQGLLILSDYGRSWQELSEHCPQGTARAYYRHEVSRDLLARPGEQDLTCHVCWDRLSAVARHHRFTDVAIQRQESFFVHHAEGAIAEILQASAGGFSREKQTLIELLHPQHMGSRFQVFSGKRF